jgi:hypothetical protein
MMVNKISPVPDEDECRSTRKCHSDRSDILILRPFKIKLKEGRGDQQRKRKEICDQKF